MSHLVFTHSNLLERCIQNPSLRLVHGIHDILFAVEDVHRIRMDEGDGSLYILQRVLEVGWPALLGDLQLLGRLSARHARHHNRASTSQQRKEEKEEEN